MGPGRNVQGCGSVGVTLWNQYFVGDWGDAQAPNSVTPLVGATDRGNDGKKWGRRRVEVSIVRGGDGLRRDPPQRSIHKEVAYDHRGEVGLPACLCILHVGREDTGDDPDGALVGSRRGKRAGGVNEEEV